MVWLLGEEDIVDLAEYRRKAERLLKPDSKLLKQILRLPDKLSRAEARAKVEILSDMLFDELGQD